MGIIMIDVTPFGDGTIQLVHLPGHAAGLVVTLIQNNGKKVLYFSDGGYATRSWKEMLLSGVLEDKNAGYKSLKWIRDTSISEDCIDYGTPSWYGLVSRSWYRLSKFPNLPRNAGPRI